MKSLLLETILEMLTNVNVLTGIILTALGVAVVLLSKRITMAVRKTDKIENNDNLYLGLLAFALILILVGMVISIIR